MVSSIRKISKALSLLFSCLRNCKHIKVISPRMVFSYVNCLCQPGPLFLIVTWTVHSSREETTLTQELWWRCQHSKHNWGSHWWRACSDTLKAQEGCEFNSLWLCHLSSLFCRSKKALRRNIAFMMLLPSLSRIQNAVSRSLYVASLLFWYVNWVRTDCTFDWFVATSESFTMRNVGQSIGTR